MIKLIALYERPEDPDAFMAHYERVHLPLVKKTPGLERVVVNEVTSAPLGGTLPYFLITELHFPDRAAFDAAMGSEQNRAAGKDLMSFAKGLVTLLVTEASGA